MLWITLKMRILVLLLALLHLVLVLGIKSRALCLVRKHLHRPGEMGQRLRAFAALPENLSSVPNPHSVLPISLSFQFHTHTLRHITSYY